jgi:hypothetical protein
VKLERRTLLQLPLFVRKPKSTSSPDKKQDTLRTLCEFIIPGAAEAGVPEFIQLLCSENAEYKRQISGGLLWLDARCRDRYGKQFLACAEAEQKELLDLIAWRENGQKDPTLTQAINFFTFLRDLTLDGYFTSRQGIAYLDFRGNSALAEFPGCPPPRST